MHEIVSVIVPVHNGERFLAECLDSVLSQDCPVELVVVDDGSGDESAAIARRRPVRYIRQARSGAASARNTGLKAARADYVTFLDQDDTFKPGKLRMQVALLEADPSLDFVIGLAEIHIEPGAPRPSWVNPAWRLGGELACQLSAMLFRRSAFERVGRFDTSYEAAYDADWMARAKDAGLRWHVHDEVVTRYRLHEGNASHGLQAALSTEKLRLLRASVQRSREEARP